MSPVLGKSAASFLLCHPQFLLHLQLVRKAFSVLPRDNDLAGTSDLGMTSKVQPSPGTRVLTRADLEVPESSPSPEAWINLFLWSVVSMGQLKSPQDFLFIFFVWIFFFFFLVAFISRKHLQFPISSVPRIMPLAKAQLGTQSVNTVWVLNVFSCPWISKWFLATSTGLKLSGGAVRMQGTQNSYRNLLFNPHVDCHNMNCNF